MDHFHSESIEDIDQKVQISIDKISLDAQLLQLKCQDMPREVVNAIRRTLFQFVPSMRIEYMYMHQQGTNVRFDDFEHRMGLVPIQVNPQLFLYPHELTFYLEQGKRKGNDNGPAMISDYDLTELVGYGIPHQPGMMPDATFLHELPAPLDEQIALCFELDVTCELNEFTQTLEHTTVYGRDVVWKPLGNQLQRFQQLNLVQMPCLQPNVVLAHLVWGQKLKWTMYAIKGNGAIHPKWRGTHAYFAPYPQTIPSMDQYQLTIKSLDITLPSQSLKESLSYLTHQFDQLAHHCQGKPP